MEDYQAQERKGHDILSLERFRAENHWMAEYIDFESGDEYRYFLDDAGFRELLDRQHQHTIRFQFCAHVTEGHIVEFDHDKHMRQRVLRWMKH